MLKVDTKAHLTTSLIVATYGGEHTGRYLCPMEVLKSLFDALENITEIIP